MLTKGDEQKVKDIIVQAIEEVIAPAMDGLADKEDIKRLETRIDQIDRKLDVMTGKVFEHDSKIKQLEHQVLPS